MLKHKDGVMLAFAAGGLLVLLAAAELGVAAAVVGVSMSAVSGFMAIKDAGDLSSEQEKKERTRVVRPKGMFRFKQSGKNTTDIQANEHETTYV